MTIRTVIAATGRCLALLALCGSLSIAAPARAQDQTACDPEYMDAIEARATLEAQREITQNKNMILKPDSVFEYSCFGNALSFLANHSGTQLLSEDGCCGIDVPNGANSLDAGFAAIVGPAVMTHLGEYLHPAYEGRALGAADSLSSSIGGFQHVCNRMSQVWQAAKCSNFLDQPSRDGFFGFRKYEGTDTRVYAAGNSFTACQAYTNISTLLTQAYNQKDNLYEPASENPNSATPYIEINQQTYFDQIKPKGHALVPNCAAAKPSMASGVRIKYSNGSEGEAKFCSNPGCYFTGSSCEPI